jgi:hypothetical protein
MGLSLVLLKFKVGAAFGYVPNPSDTGLHGSMLYQDFITSYYETPDGTLVASCTIALDAGPFDFGEIGIFTDTDQLFALASLEAPLTKYSGLGTNIASSYTFNCYLRLGVGSTVITIGVGPGSGVVPISQGGTSGTSAALARANLVVPSTTGGGASGVWPIAISGNAATATKAISLDAGMPLQIPYQVTSNNTGFIPAPTVMGQGLLFNGTNMYWGAVGGASSLAGNGYAVLSSGLIVQWGTTPYTDVGGYYDATFPVAFPNAAFSLVTGGDMGASTSDSRDTAPNFSGLTQYGVRLHPRRVFGSSTGLARVRWIALGN